MFGNRKFIGLLSRLQQEQSGSIMITTGFAIVILIVAGGAAVDYARAVTTRSTLANAIDAASLAAARRLSLAEMTASEVQDVVEDAVSANFTDRYSDVEYSIDNISVNDFLGTVTVDASAVVPTFFVKLAGINVLNVSNVSEVTYSRFDVELAIVVDVTGSMGNDMEALREATQSAVDILLPSYVEPGKSKVKISLVPYSRGVNIGSYATTVSNGEASNNCVTEREGAEKYTDARYNHAPNMQINDYFGGGESSCPSSIMLPLTDDRDTLESTISALSSGGSTAGQTGIAWGWYSISPNWAALWPSNSQPEPYTNDEVQKVMLVMTDGAFNKWYDYETETICNHSGCYSQSDWEDTYDRHAGYNDPPSVRARRFCDSIKAEDIHIYTVYFDTGGSGADDSKKLMGYCATDDASNFTAENGDQLKSEFGKIARNIQSTYLSK